MLLDRARQDLKICLKREFPILEKFELLYHYIYPCAFITMFYDQIRINLLKFGNHIFASPLIHPCAILFLNFKIFQKINKNVKIIDTSSYL